MMSKLRPVIFILICIAVLGIGAGFVLRTGLPAPIHHQLHKWALPGFSACPCLKEYEKHCLCLHNPALWNTLHGGLSSMGTYIMLMSGAALLVLGNVWIYSKPLSP